MISSIAPDYPLRSKLIFYAILVAGIFGLYFAKAAPLSIVFIVLFGLALAVKLNYRYLLGGGLILLIISSFRLSYMEMSQAIGVVAFDFLLAGILAVILDRIFAVRRDYRLRSSILRLPPNYLALGVSVIIAYVALFQVLATKGIITNGDFAFPFNSYDFSPGSLLSQWKEYGSYNGLSSVLQTLATLPFVFLGDFTQKSTATVLKLMLFVYLAASLFSTYLFARFYAWQILKKNHWLIEVGAMLAAFFYIFNPWSLAHLSQFYLWLGYAFLPGVIFLFWKAINQTRWRKTIVYLILTGLAASILSFASPHFLLYTGVALLVAWLIYIIPSLLKRDRPQVRRQIFIFLLLVAILALFNFHWLLPVLIQGNLPAPDYLALAKDAATNPSRLSSLLNLLSLRGHLAELSVFTKVSLAIFPAIFIWWLFAMRRQRYRETWTIIFICLIGLAPVLAFIMSPGLTNSFFNLPVIRESAWLVNRDIDRSASLLALVYILAILAPFIFIARRSQEILPLEQETSRPNRRWGAFLTLSLLFVLVALAVFLPIHRDQELKITRTNAEYELAKFIPVSLPPEYFSLAKDLHAKKNNYEATWLPITTQAHQYTWSNKNYVADIFTRSSGAPAIGPDSPDMRGYLSYLQKFSYCDPILGDLLSLVNTKYAIVHKDFLDGGKEQVSKIDAELAGCPANFEAVTAQAALSLLTFRNPYEYVQATYRNILVVGGYDSLKTLNDLPQLQDEKYSVAFADQQLSPADLRKLIETSDAIFWENASFLDLVTSGINSNYLVYPGDYVTSGNAINNWAVTGSTGYGNWPRISEDLTGQASWDFSLGHKIAFSMLAENSPEVKMTVPVSIDTAKEVRILARIFENPNGGNLGFKVPTGNKLKVNTKGITGEFKWVELDAMQLRPGDYSITVSNETGFNAVNAIAIVPAEILSDQEKTIADSISRKSQIFSVPINAGSLTSQVVYNLPVNTSYELRLLNNQRQVILNTEICSNDSGFICQLSPHDFDPSAIEKLRAQNILKTEMFSPYDPGIVTMPAVGKFEFSPTRSESPHRILSTNANLDPSLKYSLSLTLSVEKAKNLDGIVRYYDKENKLVKSQTLFSGLDGNLANRWFSLNISPSRDIASLKLELRMKELSQDALLAIDSVSLTPVAENQPVDVATEAILTSKNLQPEATTPLPAIEFKKESASRTRVHVSGADQPFYLVFAESYDDEWRLTLPPGAYAHFPAYGATNGFLIDQTGDFQFDIVFGRQRSYDIGLKIALISIGGGLILVLVLLIAFRWPERKKA